MVKKRIIPLFLAIVFLFPAYSAYATEADETVTITPVLTYISTITPNLAISGNTASCTVKITASSSVTKVSATVTLQKQSSSGTYSDVATWSASSSSNYLSTTGTYSVTSGVTYRLKVTVTVTTSSGNETTTVYSAAKTA